MGRIFYKYRAINEYTKQSISEKVFHYSRQQELNDTFDGRIGSDYNASYEEISAWTQKIGLSKETVDKIIKEAENGSLEKRMDNSFIKMNNRFLYFCLSEVWDESIMWGLYADSSKGICLGYNTIFDKEAYILQMELLNRSNRFYFKEKEYYVSVLLKIIYDKKQIEKYNPFRRNIDSIKDSNLHKEQKWSFEKEYRSIIFDEDDGKLVQNQIYRSNILKEVIFGEKTSKNDMLEIYDLVKSKYVRDIKFYKVYSNIANMKIQRKNIEYKDIIVF